MIEIIDTGKSTKIITKDREYSCPYGSLVYKKTGQNSFEIYYFGVFILSANITEVSLPIYTDINDLLDKLSRIDDENSNSGTTDYNDLSNKPTFKTINGEELLGTGDIAISVGGNANYNVDERNFDGLMQYGTPSGFTSQVRENANWGYTGSSNPTLFNSEDYGNYSRLRCQLEINGKFSMAIRTQPIFYSLGSNNELKMTFVFNQNWDTRLGACIGLFGDTFFFNSVSALLTRRCIGVYFDTTTQRFVCVCRNSLTTQVVLDPIPLNISYLKIAITIGNGRVIFEVSYMTGGSPVTQVVTITTNIPGYSFSANATYPTLFFEQIGGTSFIFTPSIRRIQLQIL